MKDIIYSQKNNWNLYPPLSGTNELNNSYLNWLERSFGVSKYFDEKNILPLSGTKEGLFSISMALNARKICLPNPFYQVYLGASLFNNLEKVFLLSDKVNNYFPNLQILKRNLRTNSSIVYLCSPSNPQGKITDFSYLEELIKIIRYFNSVLVIDECYIDLYYNKKPIGALEVCEKLGKGLRNVLIFHSLSKRSNVAGLRSGFVIGDKEIIKNFRKLRSYSAPTIPVPLQIASAKLWDDEEHVKRNRKKYQKKVTLAANILNKYKGFESPEAGFFLWLKVNNGELFAKKLFTNYSIKVMPGKYLADGKNNNPGKNYVRIALVHSYDKIKSALKKILNCLND